MVVLLGVNLSLAKLTSLFDNLSMELGLSIFLGVISGVITSLVVWFFYKIIYLKVYLPWQQERVYDGPNMEGGWSGGFILKQIHESERPGQRHEFEAHIDMEINITNQQGHSITGFFHARSYQKISGEEKDSYTNDYMIQGNVIGNYILLTYNPASKKRMGLGSFVLEIKDGGKRLEGGSTFVNEEDMLVATLDHIKLIRRSE
jgi:hypothetical protein